MFISVILFSCFITLEGLANVMFIISNMGISEYLPILTEVIPMFVESAAVFSK